jgi:hypothetical protein
MTSINFYERTALIKRIENNLNQINQRYFEGGHVILSVTDNGDYLTVKKQGVYLAGYDAQKLFDALEDFSEEVREFLFPYDLWDYLNHCKYTPENQESDNELKTDDKLSLSEKTHLNKYIKQLQEEYQELKREDGQLFEQLTALSETVTQLCIRVYKLENNQTEPQPEPKPTAKRPKYKLPENFADYQQECDDLIDELSCFYNIKKGKWGKDILQFILTPVRSTTHPYPNKWKAGLYLQPGEWTWTIDKVSMSDPDEWKEHFINVYDFAVRLGIEIS